MIPELTTADDFEIARTNDRVSDDVTISRWSKQGDRLYINDLAGYDVYVDLKMGALKDITGRHNGNVTVDGDTMTVTFEWVETTPRGSDRTPDRIEYVVEIDIMGEEFETTDDDGEGSDEMQPADSTDQPLVADGGEDASDIVSQQDIEARLEKHDDTHHEDAYTTEQVRDAFAALQQDLATKLHEYNGDERAVYEDRDLVIYSDPTGDDLGIAMESAGVENDEYGILSTILGGLMHDVAGRCCGRNWSATYPVVIRKPRMLRDGEAHVESRIAKIASGAGVSEAAAMDYWSVEIKGRSQSQWARMVGKSQQTVSENIQKVKDGLGAELS